MQSEITNAAGEGGDDFAIHSVTRAFLPLVQNWPETGNVTQFDWLAKQKAPIGRVILPGDVISLAIWDSGDNSLLTTQAAKVANLNDTKVTENGTIFIPYVGSVRVSGLSDGQARQKIQNAMIKISPSAQVQLSSKAGPRHAVNLVSGVKSPGSFPLEERDMTILSAISAGGGVDHGMENPQIRLLRDNKVYATSLEYLLKSPALDTTLKGGDKIVIAGTEKYFLSLGASGREDLIPFPKEHLTALDAVSLIGGVNDTRANLEGVLVLREYEAGDVRSDPFLGPSHQRVIFTLDLTTQDGLFSAGKFEIMPKDLIYATESPITNTRTILGLLGTGLGIAQRLN